MIDRILQPAVDRFEAARKNRLNEWIERARQVFAQYLGGATPSGYGAFGAATLDLDRWTRTLKGPGEPWNLSEELAQLEQQIPRLPGSRWVDINSEVSWVHQFNEQLAPYEDLVGLLRQAEALSYGRWVRPERPSWQDFSPAEWSLCPLVLVEGSQASAGLLLDLLASGLPLKILVQRSLQACFQARSGRGAALQPEIDLGWMAAGLRSAYSLCVPAGWAGERLEAGLASARAALFCLIEVPEEFEQLAVDSRTILPLCYDPDRAEKGAGPLELIGVSLNCPGWLPVTEEGLDDEGEACTREGALTPADLYARLSGAAAQFDGPPADQPGISLADYLAADHERRLHHLPTLAIRRANLRWTQEVVPPWLVGFCQRRLDLWQQALRQLGPLEAPSQAKPPVAAPSEVHPSPAEAVRSAMARLAAKLMGLEPSGLEALSGGLANPTTAVEPPKEQPPKPLTSSSGLPWIDSAKCTSCDECTRINAKIFAYNDQKQAFIKDPKAGPFRDLVKAAEKCSASIIHPGSPLNPQEKDLAKWVARAAKYP
ncbi:MAG: ferredoxin [bacterium]|nr:ferredoxin [bacterium]